MPELTHFDFIVLIATFGVFVVGLWSTIFAFLYGFQKRLDQIILLLREQNSQAASDE